jgi:hypothetical protein
MRTKRRRRDVRRFTGTTSNEWAAWMRAMIRTHERLVNEVGERAHNAIIDEGVHWMDEDEMAEYVKGVAKKN